MTKKKIFTKKEKDLTQRITKAGSHTLEVFIRAYDQSFRKNVNIADFDSPSQAMSFAVQLRDDTLKKMRDGYTVSRFKTVKEIYDKTFELFPVRVKTKMRHDVFFRTALQPYAESPINEITSADVQLSLNKYARNHTKRQTVGLLAIWRRIYKACAMMNINVIDRTVGVIVPECMEGTPRKKSISSADLDKFCSALLAYNSASVSGNYYCKSIYFAIQIMRFCGLRPSETFALMKSDINLLERTITVNKAAHSTQDSMLEIGKVKTERSSRTIPIPDELLPVLVECLGWSRHEILLADYRGNLMNIDAVCTTILNVRKKVNVDFNLYMLRHQFSTDLFNSNVPANTIQSLMGLESSAQTLAYATADDEAKIKALNSRKFS